MVKRYDKVTHGTYQTYEEMDPSDEGEWVRYDDHVAAIAKLRAVVEAAIRAYRDAIVRTEAWSHSGGGDDISVMQEESRAHDALLAAVRALPEQKVDYEKAADRLIRLNGIHPDNLTPFQKGQYGIQARDVVDAALTAAAPVARQVACDKCSQGVMDADGPNGPGNDHLYGRCKCDCHVPAERGEVVRPRIVCLCGSTRFFETWIEQNYLETMAGRIVLGVGFYPHCEDKAHAAHVGVTGPEVKERLDELHKRKIDLADEILVLNVGGYVGESTRSEIEYAEAHGKPVRWLEAGPSPSAACATCRHEHERHRGFTARCGSAFDEPCECLRCACPACRGEEVSS